MIESLGDGISPQVLCFRSLSARGLRSRRLASLSLELVCSCHGKLLSAGGCEMRSCLQLAGSLVHRQCSGYSASMHTRLFSITSHGTVPSATSIKGAWGRMSALEANSFTS